MEDQIVQHTAQESYKLIILLMQVWHFILDQLPILDKKTARLVCNSWRQIIDNVCCPKSVVFRLQLNGKNPNHNETMKHFMKSDCTMSSVSVEACDMEMADEETRFPYIEGEVVIGGKQNSEATVINFMTYGCANANSLAMLEGSLINTSENMLSVAIENLNRFAGLTTLKIECYPSWANVSISKSQVPEPDPDAHINSCCFFFKHVRLPNLSDMFIKLLPYQSPAQPTYQNIIKNFFLFLGNHVKTIRNLTYLISKISKWPSTRLGLPVTDLKLNCCNILTSDCNIGSFLILPNLVSGCGLKTICLDVVHFEHFTQEGFEQSHFYQDIQNMLAANSNTLEVLNLHLDQFDINWLQPCVQLKSLTLSLGFGTEGVPPSLHNSVSSHSLMLPKLENLKLRLLLESRLIHGYKRLLDSTGVSLKQLEFGIAFDEGKICDWHWLNSCVNIETLHMTSSFGFFSTFWDNMLSSVFVCLKEFRTMDFPSWNDRTHLRSAEWMVEAMPNLVTLTIDTKNIISLRALNTLLAIPGLKDIYLARKSTQLHDLQIYCDYKENLELTRAKRGQRCSFSQWTHGKLYRIHRRLNTNLPN